MSPKATNIAVNGEHMMITNRFDQGRTHEISLQTGYIALPFLRREIKMLSQT